MLRCGRLLAPAVPVGDGEKDSNLCKQPVQIAPDLRIPHCMSMITASDVIRPIEMYHEGGSLQYNDRAVRAGGTRNDV